MIFLFFTIRLRECANFWKLLRNVHKFYDLDLNTILESSVNFFSKQKQKRFF